MAFSTGDYVQVLRFGKGIVREVRNAGRYAVEVRGRVMIVDASQLAAVAQQKRRAGDRHQPPAAGPPGTLARAQVSTSIDLHGMTVEQAIGAVEAFLSDAILAGLAEVQVIHGRGGGRLKHAVHQRLKVLPSIRGFRLHPVNPGVTIVSL